MLLGLGGVGRGGGVQSAKQKEGVKEEQPDYVSWLEEVL